VNNVVLVGFMGSGKTTVGRELAARLGRPFVDLDDEVAADAGRPVREIFADEGEAGFRQRETRVLEQVLAKDDAVIAAGGGAPMRDENWQQIRSGNTVVALMVEPAEVLRRLNGSKERPLLEPDPPSAVASLLPQRLPRYLAADLVLPTDGHAPEQVADWIVEGLPGSGLLRIPVRVPAAMHEVVVGSGLTRVIASAIQRMSIGSPIVVISDAIVADRHAAPLLAAISAQGLRATLYQIPAGEAAKELAVLSGIYDALARSDVDRGSLLVALGGGTVGDVAGFAAATWMRGVRYLQVPTTLLGMVDSSIGGKTAINLPAGKNMVGAVYQPAAIFCDLDYLATLPDADFRASLAELIKAAVIADRSFAEWLATNLPGVVRRQGSALLEAIARSIAIKAEIVARDPYEGGKRAILNYGHTVGHALERAAGFGSLRHGEAVAWGMEVEARVSVLSGRCAQEAAEFQHELLADAGLLRNQPAVDRTALLDAMRHDKKSRGGQLRWVLLRELGRAEHGVQVDAAVVSSALAEVMQL
jgi:3-dehydroquinate synthase